MTKQQLIDQLNSTIADFAFIPVSKVIELVSKIEETPSSADDILLDRVRSVAEECLNYMDFSDYMILDDAEISVSYREITIDEVPFRDDKFVRDFMGRFNKSISEEISKQVEA